MYIKSLLRPLYVPLFDKKEQLVTKTRALLLKNKRFSIISNNCIGGFIYQHYGIEYHTPTLGLFFTAEDYLKFLKNIKFYISQPLEFINLEKSIYYNFIKNTNNYGSYPVGKISDIEIFFMHYKNEEEAFEKWNRRKNKINWDNLIIVLAEGRGCTIELLRKFDNLTYKNKVCFTRKKYPEIKTAVYIEEMNDSTKVWCVRDIVKHFNLTKYINSI